MAVGTLAQGPSTETKLLLISADSHVTEDPNLWQERLPRNSAKGRQVSCPHC